ncbi:MAG: MFS transporter [Caldilineaceae bacterium]|nr:MFS transporter [Caldilineaceae bacterium]
MLRRFDAYKVYLFLEGAQSLLFSMIFTASMIYQITVVGLSPLQLVLVGTLLEIVYFSFEIPTGIVADVYSRRLSIIVGLLLIGIGFFVEGSIPLFAAVLAAQIFWGIGATFTSGATEAWISDEIGEKEAGRAFLRAAQVGNITGIAGIGASMLLGSIFGVAAPVWVGGALIFVLGVVIALIMPEMGFKPTPRTERSTWRHLTGTFRQGVRTVRGRPLLVKLMAVGVVMGMFSEGFDRLNSAHLINNFVFPTLFGRTFETVVWFGVLGVIGRLLYAGVTEVVRKRLNMEDDRAISWALTGFTALLVASILIFALSPSLILAIAALLVVGITRGLIGPVFNAWVNQHIGSDANVRATVFSMYGQADAIGQVAGGPVVGAVGNWSLRAALTMSALLLLPAVGLFARATGREVGEDLTQRRAEAEAQRGEI